jgi:tetratricopeptide (TPR) repeat protein
LQLGEVDLVSSLRLETQTDPNFVGREGAIDELNTLINKGAKVIVIQARGGVGKTTLARKYLQQEFGSYLEFPIAKETKDIASIESLIEEKLRQLGEEPGREFFVSLDRLKCKLQNERIGILIDNLEPTLDSTGKFIEPHRLYVELLRVLADPVVQSITLITSRERLNEYSITTNHYLLRELSLTAWEQFFQSRYSLEGKAFGNEDSSVLCALHRAYGGNAKAMDILCSAILTDYGGEAETYWQANQDDLLIERALEDLVVSQFDRLQRTNLDAYNLLCRMGCYRYQDVPTVPLEGLLCLLWDVPENRQRRVVKSLQERSLIDYEDGEFWLHPVTRAEAILRLRNSNDWELTNRKAIDTLTKLSHDSETINDALRVLEAYHHCIEINDIEEASNSLTRRIKNRWGEPEPFGHSCFRLGLYEKLLAAIEKIISRLETSFSLAILYHFLGSIYRERGLIYQSIESYEFANNIALEVLEKSGKSEIKQFEPSKRATLRVTVQLNYSFNLTLNSTYLWRFEDALKHAEKFNKFNLELLEEVEMTCVLHPKNLDLLMRVNYHKGICTFAQILLSYIHVYLGEKKVASALVEEYDQKIFDAALNSWVRGMALVFIGFVYKELGNTTKSINKFHESLSYARESNYSKVEGLSLLGLAEICRDQKEFSNALLYNLDSIRILEYGAKCDLPEAYYQIGLTYQAMGEFERSSENFQRAIRLFSEMEAPKQIERVKRSI